MAEEYDVEMYFLPINTSKIPLHGEQLEQLLQLNAGRRLQTSKNSAKLHIKLSGKGNKRNKETKKMGLVLCLGEGAMKEENFPHTQKLPLGRDRV